MFGVRSEIGLKVDTMIIKHVFGASFFHVWSWIKQSEVWFQMLSAAQITRYAWEYQMKIFFWYEKQKMSFLSYKNVFLKLDKIQYLQAKFHIIFESLETETKIMM